MTSLAGIYYFGCVGETGHRLWDGNLNSTGRRLPPDFPVDPSQLDGGIFPMTLKRGAEQGLAHVRHIGGWTLMGFADFSVDRRPGSHSIFIAKGKHTFEQMVSLFASYLPSVYRRLTYPLIEAHS